MKQRTSVGVQVKDSALRAETLPFSSSMANEPEDLIWSDAEVFNLEMDGETLQLWAYVILKTCGGTTVTLH